MPAPEPYGERQWDAYRQEQPTQQDKEERD